jgi:hypothetical protein
MLFQLTFVIMTDVKMYQFLFRNFFFHDSRRSKLG